MSRRDCGKNFSIWQTRVTPERERELFVKWYFNAYGALAFLSPLHSEPNGRDAAHAWTAWKARASYDFLDQLIMDSSREIEKHVCDSLIEFQNK